MSLTRVKMSEEVWLTCVSHALTTEKEEVMGLLFGDTESINGGVTALIWGALPQMRCDRRKDRVETDPKLLANASAEAERMTVDTGRTTRVIGWYHSHPHITVFPSHIDVRTQAMYQILDSGFIGLIFSCYCEDTQKTGKIQVIAFQSLDGQQQHVKPVIRNSLIDIGTSLSSSGSQPILSATHDSPDEDSGDSRATKAAKVDGASANSRELFSYPKVNYSEAEKQKGTLFLSNVDNLEELAFDSDSISMTASMQEAIHRSNLEIRGAEYTRKEVPLEVLPSSSLLWYDAPLKSFIDMQHVLFEEEKAAYNQAIEQNTCEGKMHPLSFIHHTSTYQASLCKLVEHCLSPAVATLNDRKKENEIRLAMLMEEAKSLEAELESKETVPSKVLGLPSKGAPIKTESPRPLQTYVRKHNMSTSSTGSRSTGSGGGSR